MTLAQDIRYAVRRLSGARGYTVAAITTLALAIGSTTAIFSAVHAVLLKPMPIREPGNLVVVWGTGESLAMRVIELSYLDIQDVGDATRGVGSVAAVGSSTWSMVLDGEGDPVELRSTGVSGRFFEVLGATPRLGRTIQPGDDRTNSAGVVVISSGLWTRQFGSDPNIIGRRVRLDDQAYDIVGVMPAAFDYPRGTEIWRAAAPVLGDGSGGGNPNPLRNVGVFFMIGRLNAGITPPMANDEWSRAHEVVQQSSKGPKYDITVTPFLDHHIGPARQALWILLGAVGVLLLIACANVSGLMLTRVALRNHDDAIRLAIGGSRAAIGRLWTAEIVWLSLAGALLGVIACRWLLGAIVALAPDGIPRLDEIAIDTPVFLFTIAVMTAATLLCGAAPIRHAGALNLVETLNDGSRTVAGGRSYRTRSLLLVTQIGLSVVLLVAAGLVVRSFDALRRFDLGFDREAVLRLNVTPRAQAQPVNDWINALLEQIAAMPGVDSAGAVYLTPMELGSIGQGSWVVAEGQPETPETANRNPMLNYLTATPGYFEAMRIPLRRGRLFTDDDRANTSRVAVISESTAAAFFPGQDPIGKRLKTASHTAKPIVEGEWRTVIGVVGNVSYRGLEEKQLDFYDAPAQTISRATSIVVKLRRGEEQKALALASAIQARARQSDPTAIVSGIAMLDSVVDREMAPWRFSAWVFALFAGLAFALSMLGLFSLVSLDVANRRQEFAIRMAMGATHGHIVVGVFRSAGVRAAVGIAIGLTVAAVATRSLESQLFGVGLTDRLTYGAVIALVLAVVAIASYLPARRATDASPMALLRRQ